MHVFKHPKFYEEYRQRAKREQARKRAADGGRVGPKVTSSQDNNASFEGISEAEYNKRHMKALKDADPGLKRQASSVKLSNQPEQASSDKRQAPGSKLQASSHKRQAP